MMIARFEWPADMTRDEALGCAQVEAEVAIVARRFAAGRPALRELAAELVDRIDDLSPAGLRGRLRVVVDEYSVYPSSPWSPTQCRVRFTWHRYEFERRAADLKARQEREERDRRLAERRRDPSDQALRYIARTAGVSIEVARADFERLRSSLSNIAADDIARRLAEIERLALQGTITDESLAELRSDLALPPAAAAPPPYPTIELRYEPKPRDPRVDSVLESSRQIAKVRREQEAVVLMARIVIVALRAKERASELAGVFYVVLEACLRPWAANPSPIELDIGHAPFGVDLSPAEDPTAARFALLEIGDYK